jgi:DNA-binding response OmpR family regulator
VISGYSNVDAATTVGFLSAAGQGGNSFIQELEQEVVRVRSLDLDELEHDQGPGKTVTLCWLPRDCDWMVLTDIVAWRGRADHTAGLIGLVADGDVADRETGLAAGFDDIVVGPLSAKEVAARVRALSRRLRMTITPRTGATAFGPLQLDLAKHEVYLDGQPVKVTRTEMAVLSDLIGAGGRTRSRTEILDAAWGGHNASVGARAVDNVILRLRRKLGRPELIVTVRGVGFRLAD